MVGLWPERASAMPVKSPPIEPPEISTSSPEPDGRDWS
jgi:hypothetical protein